jgi:hypothetical protein
MGISEATFYNWKQKYGVGEYNERRLHSSLNWMTASEYALKCWETTPNNHATQGPKFLSKRGLVIGARANDNSID